MVLTKQVLGFILSPSQSISKRNISKKSTPKVFDAPTLHIGKDCQDEKASL